MKSISIYVIAMLASQAGCPAGVAGASVQTRVGGAARVEDTEPAGAGASTLRVPDLIGKTLDEARALVRAAGFSHAPERTRPVVCDDAPQTPGKVNCQDPPAGAVVARYAVIYLNVFQERAHPGVILRSQLATLRGLSPDAVTAQLRRFGHTGKAVVRALDGRDYDPGCGVDTVCKVVSERGALDIPIEDDAMLYVNPKLTIAPPPP
jgi:hypothetical protein